VALAERLETTPITFPTNHAGFLGGESGQMGEPDAFAPSAPVAPVGTSAVSALEAAPGCWQTRDPR
jgi:hypothetical protein